MNQIGIVGAGNGGLVLLKILMNTPGIKVVGIADPNMQSPGIKYAEETGIYATADFVNILKLPGAKMIIDATGVQAVADKLSSLANEQTVIVPSQVAELLWDIVEERESVNNVLLDESTSLLSFIESGIVHIEELNQKTDQTMDTTNEKIQSLQSLTTSSHHLLQETEAILKMIRNIADKTRILGINASIESAHAGEHGRGFGVVADAIHELAANSIDSAKTVTGTLNDISKSLQNIEAEVEQVVTEFHTLKRQQNDLAQEIHSSLEEMGKSAENLRVLSMPNTDGKHS